MEVNINQHVLSTDNLQAAFNKDLASRNPKDNFIEHKFESREKLLLFAFFLSGSRCHEQNKKIHYRVSFHK